MFRIKQGDETTQMVLAQEVNSSVDNSGLEVIDGDGFDEEDDRNQEEIERVCCDESVYYQPRKFLNPTIRLVSNSGAHWI